tara:strand:+ start:642 stop:893 length:252 start_codon:yes stop_codon:yes gene_type:complete
MANTLFNQTSSNIKVSIGGSGGIENATSANTITLSSSGGTGSKRLTDLTDVNDTVEVDGGTLVYNASTDEYVLKKLPIDGGTF